MIVRRAFAVMAVAAVMGAALGCRGEAPAREARPSARASEEETIKTATLAVQGMTCTACGVAVKWTLERVAGVVSAEVDYEGAMARAQYDPARVEVAELVQAIESLGYSARAIETGQ